MKGSDFQKSFKMWLKKCQCKIFIHLRMTVEYDNKYLNILNNALHV